MDRRGIQRLAAAQLTPERYRELADHGEEILVERKRQITEPEKLGAVVSSMANMIGGWILLGVDDKTRQLHTLDLAEGTDLQSHVGNVLRKAVDPVPPYLADTLEVDGVLVGYIRVFEASAPVLVRGTGAVYSRDAGGKRPVSDHRELLELARAGEEAEDRARERPNENALTLHALGLPFEKHPTSSSGMHIVVRAAPLTVTPQLSEWPITDGPSAATEAAEALGKALAPSRQEAATVRPYGRAVVARALPIGRELHGSPLSLYRATVVADCAGVFGATSISDVPNVVAMDQLDAYIAPPLAVVADVLERAEAYGDAVLDLHLTYGRDDVSLAEKINVGRDWHALPRMLHCGSEILNVPADETDRRELAERWTREVARQAGIAAWEQPG